MTSFLVFIMVIFVIDLASKLDRFHTRNFTINPTVMKVEAATSVVVLVIAAVLVARAA